MRKYSLYFKDKKVEERYQEIVQKQFRKLTFNIVTVAISLLCFVKLIEKAVAKEYILTIMYAGIIIYLAIQYCIAIKYKSGVRIALLLLNYIISIVFNLQIQDVEDYYYSFLRGANVMGANFLLSFSGEFLDASISSLSTMMIRTLMVLLRSQKIEFSALLSTILIGLVSCRYSYLFHKASRSQYLLTLNDSHWENVLNTIAYKQPHLLYSFLKENLNFSLVHEGPSCSFFKFQFSGSQFLKDAKFKGISLENFLYHKIKQFSADRISIFNQTLIVQYFRKLFRIEYSIFYGNKPTIIIILRDYLIEKKKEMKLYEYRHRQLIKLLIKVLNVQENKQPKLQFKYLRRNLIKLQLIEEIKLGKLQQGQINLQLLVHQLSVLYPELQIKAIIDKYPQIWTIPNIFMLFFLFIMENTDDPKLFVYLNEQQGKMVLTLKGQFLVTELCKQIANINDYLRLIISKYKIDETNIEIVLNQQIYIPFFVNEIATENSEQINF